MAALTRRTGRENPVWAFTCVMVEKLTTYTERPNFSSAKGLPAWMASSKIFDAEGSYALKLAWSFCHTQTDGPGVGGPAMSEKSP